MRRLAAVALAVTVVLSLTACASTTPNASSSEGLHASAPDVVGMSLDEANQKIQNSGYELGSVTKQKAGPEPGTVVSQEPVGGTSMPRGSDIDLVVAE